MVRQSLRYCGLTFAMVVLFVSQVVAKPVVYVMATGGTIAGASTSATKSTQYKAGTVLIDTLLSALPKSISSIATIKAEQVFSIGSQDMKPVYWLQLAKQVNEVLAQKEVSGVVITHGTDTLEETALFLTLTVKSNKPVILVGAMRSSTGVSADGPKNLYDAIVVASSAKAVGRGVLVVMNDKIMSASDIMKTKTTSVETFRGMNVGSIGEVFGDTAFFYANVERAHTTKSVFSVANLKTLPEVDILYGYAGASGKAVDSAVAQGAKGIIYAGVGNGNVSSDVEKALINARKKGVVIVRASRVPSGATTQWAEVDDEKYGFITAWWNNPQRARVILMLGLTKTKDIKALQKMMLEY